MRYNLSHLTRGAWIEIRVTPPPSLPILGRTSHEVRGLKSIPCGPINTGT